MQTLGCLLGLLVQVMTKPGSSVAVVANLFGSIPLLVLFAPMINRLFEGLSLRMTMPLMVPVVLFVGALLPLLGPILSARPIDPGDAPVNPGTGATSPRAIQV
jgi:hypothetical protein